MRAVLNDRPIEITFYRTEDDKCFLNIYCLLLHFDLWKWNVSNGKCVVFDWFQFVSPQNDSPHRESVVFVAITCPAVKHTKRSYILQKGLLVFLFKKLPAVSWWNLFLSFLKTSSTERGQAVDASRECCRDVLLKRYQ